MRLSLPCGVLSLSLLLMLTAVAGAQDASEPPEYRTTIREALAEYHAKNFPEARALFTEAHRLLPNARTLRGLGMTAFELRSYAESIGYLQDALASPVKPLEGGLRAETERLLKRAERFVAKLQLTTIPNDATVTVDGAPVARREGEPLVLEIGQHELAFHADGYTPESRTFTVKGRENESWNVVLTKLPPPVAHVPPPSEVAEQAVAEQPEPASPVLPASDTRDDRPLRKNPWLWTGVGAAVVAGVVTGVVLATRDPGVAPVEQGINTPTGGILSGLRGAP